MPNEIGRRCSASSNACCQKTARRAPLREQVLRARERTASFVDLLGVGLDVRVAFLVQLPEPARDEREHRDLETRWHA